MQTQRSPRIHGALKAGVRYYGEASSGEMGSHEGENECEADLRATDHHFRVAAVANESQEDQRPRVTYSGLAAASDSHGDGAVHRGRGTLSRPYRKDAGRCARGVPLAGELQVDAHATVFM